MKSGQPKEFDFNGEKNITLENCANHRSGTGTGALGKTKIWRD